jgi:hypothetical protein
MERRQLGLSVLAIFLVAAAVTGLGPALGFMKGTGLKALTALGLVLVMLAAGLLAGASARTPRRALFGTLLGIVGVGLMGWLSTGTGFVLGLRVASALTILALVPKAWGRQRGAMSHGR